MAAIPSNFGVGGANIVPSGAQGTPTLAEALRDLVDDVTSGRVAGTALSSAVTSPDATDLPSALTLLNEIKTKLNAQRVAQVAAAPLKSTKV